MSIQFLGVPWRGLYWIGLAVWGTSAAVVVLHPRSEDLLARRVHRLRAPVAWESQRLGAPGLNIRYPSSDGGSYATRADEVITIAGGNVQCGSSWCKEDVLDWDVIAHEVGHVVAYRGDIDSSPGGNHDVCDDAWTTTGSKPDGTYLAWSEGWASFWGQIALREAAKPGRCRRRHR